MTRLRCLSDRAGLIVNVNDKNDRADPISQGVNQGHPPVVSILPAVIVRIAALERRVSAIEKEHRHDTCDDPANSD